MQDPIPVAHSAPTTGGCASFFHRIIRPAAFHLLVAACLVGASTQLSQAQFKASLRGAVVDQQGAVIPGATVTLTDKSTNRTITVMSDQNGIYTFNALPPDRFRLSAAHAGFDKKVLDDVTIIPEQLNALNVTLNVGQVNQTVTVSGETRALDSQTATLSATISSNEIQHLPSFNRDVFQLAQLTPGVFGDASQGGGGGAYNLPGNQGPGGTGGGSGGIFETENGPQIQTRGGQYETNGISIDGISTVSAVWGGTSVITPSEDSVSDLKVVANSYDAENGRFSGGQIEVTTKSGTNDVHASAFFKASRPGLNAYQRWNGLGSEQPGTPSERGLNRDDNRFNQYGASLGGPLWKNKLFAFFNFESSPNSSSSTAQGWYETTQFDQSAGASGSIAAKYLSYKGEGAAASSIVNETCANAGLIENVNCVTVSGGLDLGSPLKTGLGQQDLSYGGSSSSPGIGGGFDGVPDLAYFNTVDPTNTTQNQYNGRLDADVTKKDRLTFTIYWVPVTTTDYNGPVRSANLWHHTQVNDAFAVIWLHTFSPTLINQARANAAGWRWNEVSSNPQEPFGLPEDNINNIGSTSPQFFGAPGPSNLNQWTYDYNDVLTKTLGNQNIKVGGDLTRLYYLNNPVYAARPSFNFDNLWDFANDAPYFENGQFNHATGVPFANRQDDRLNIWGVFAQDDWQIRPNLTINLGLRWSYFGGFYSKESNLDVLQFGNNADPLDGLNVRVGGNLQSYSKGNFGPQVGFAWQPAAQRNRLVVRGGFGVSYNQDEIAILANGNGNPPNAVQANFTCPYPYNTNPSCANTGILYQTAGSINSIFGYAPNPATITAFDSNNLPLTGSIFATGFPTHPSTITNYHYSLDTQYQLPFDTVAMIGYQGSLTRNLIDQYNYNVVAGARGNALNPKVNFLDYYDNQTAGNYNALIATLTHNFSHHFQAEAQYTWAKAMDEGSGPYEEDPYPFDVHAAYGRSDYNVGNAFKLFGLWQPIIFHGNARWLEKVAGGWSISGIWNVHTGFPWTPFYNLTGNNIYYSGSGYGQLRPAAYTGGAGTKTSNGTFKQQTNPNYGGNASQFFTAPAYVSGAAFPAFSAPPTPGIERNSLNGPGYNDVDGTLAKDFGLPKMRILGDNARFEIRADAYNFFNRLNLNTGSIDNVVASATPTGGVTSPNSDFGVARSALGSRTVQLQARFSF